MKNIEKIEKGTINLTETVDITDPCYNKDVWCRKTFRVRPGTYNCVYWLKDEGEWGKRVHSSMIYNIDVDGIEDMINNLDYWNNDVEEIGVDAGLAGFFDNKPDFSNDEWFEFCQKLPFSENAFIESFDGRDGFFTSSGYGDGGYPVDILLDPDDASRIVAAHIQFL